MKLLHQLSMLSPSTFRTDLNTTATSTTRSQPIWGRPRRHLISPESTIPSPSPPTPGPHELTAVVTPDHPTFTPNSSCYNGNDSPDDDVTDMSILGTKPEQIEQRMRILSPRTPAAPRIVQLVDIILVHSYGTAATTSSTGNNSGNQSPKSNHRADAPVLYTAMDELAALLRPDPKRDGAIVRVAFFRACAHLAVVKAMQHHRCDCGVQTRGCHILSHLCCCKSVRGENYNLEEIGGIKELGLGLGAIGAMEAIMQAMKVFPKKLSVQSYCMTALSNLSYFENNEQLLVAPLGSCSYNKKKRGAGDNIKDLGITLVLMSMTTFPDEGLIQHHGCRILKHVCKSPTHIPVVIEAKGIGVIAGVLERFSKPSAAHEQANKAMKLILNE